MDSFGAFIKAEREKKGISLKEISNVTKISHHILEALESDHVDEFPYPAFAKGFLNTYAKQLGLDSHEVIARYEDFLTNNHIIDQRSFLFNDTQALGMVGFDQTKILTRAERMHGKRFFPAFLIVFLIVGIWFAWSIFLKQTSLSMHDVNRNPLLSQRIQKIQKNAPKLNQAASDILKIEQPKMEPSKIKQTETGQPEISPGRVDETIMASAGIEQTFMNVPKIEKNLINTLQDEEPLEMKEETSSIKKKDHIKNADVPSISEPILKASSTLPIPSAEASQEWPPEKELVITATERTWIDIGIDDLPRFDFIIEPGDRMTFNANSTFSLWIGNAGGVNLTYEGELIGPLGNVEQVVRLDLPM